MFRQVCLKYLRRFAGDLNWYEPPQLDDPARYNVEVNGYRFDFAQSDQDRRLYVKIWDSVTQTLPKEEFTRMDEASVPENPFYNNTYVLFSVRRFTNFYESLTGKYENVHTVDLKALLQKKYRSVFELD